MMVETPFEQILAQAERLPPQDRLRLVERLAASLHTAVAAALPDWHQTLRQTYGILKDDPIERPSQLPLDERDPIL